MRNLTRAIFLAAAAAIATATPAADESTIVPRSDTRFETLRLAKIPAYRPTRRADGNFEEIDRPRIVRELTELSGVGFHERGNNPLPPPLPRISCRFDRYSAVDQAWFGDFLRWFRNELTYHLGLDYRKESWDCDDFATTLNAMADLALLGSAGHPPPQLIGRMRVVQARAWAGVEPCLSHELVIHRSEKGWFVTEPQNGQTVALRKYPNRRQILEVLFN